METDPSEVERWRARYLTFARGVSYVMPVRSAAKGAVNAFGWLYEAVTGGDTQKKLAEEESILGGSFLRMYLDQRIDWDVIAEAGVEIGGSEHWASLTSQVNAKLQRAADRSRASLTAVQVKQIAHDHMQSLLRREDGLKFEGALNPVIGHVGGLEVTSAQLGSTARSAGSRKVTYSFKLDVLVRDKYDFTNRRVAEYTRYRESLATLLKANRFVEFNQRCFQDATVPEASHFMMTFGRTSLFASYMYALEMRGWTGPGFDWQVMIPMTISFDDADVESSPRARGRTP